MAKKHMGIGLWLGLRHRDGHAGHDDLGAGYEVGDKYGYETGDRHGTEDGHEARMSIRAAKNEDDHCAYGWDSTG